MTTASALGQKTGPVQTGGLYQHSTTSQKRKKNKNQVAHPENCETCVHVYQILSVIASAKEALFSHSNMLLEQSLFIPYSSM